MNDESHDAPLQKLWKAIDPHSNETLRAASDALRKPFPPEQINTLPKPYDRNSPKGKCTVCNGFHGLPAAHLDYVGHAEATDRLLAVDPAWTWEPLALGDDGLPAFDKQGGLWIKLTVTGVTRLGYGDSAGKSGPNAVKEAIGDGIRNAAMRFGVALDLWAKSDLSAAMAEKHGEPVSTPVATVRRAAPATKPVERERAPLHDPTIDNAGFDPAPDMVERDQFEVPVGFSAPLREFPKAGQSALRKSMFAMLKSLGLDSRDDMLQYVEATVGHPVGSSKDLTEVEVRLMCDTMRPLIDKVPS